MSDAAPMANAARVGGIAGPMVFAFGVVAAVQLAAGGATLAAGLAGFAALAGFSVMSWSMRMLALDGRSRLPTPERARLRFQILHAVLIVAFVLSFVFLAPRTPEAGHPALSFAYAATPVLLLMVLVAEFVRMVVLSDEMERREHVTAIAVAAGALVVGSTLWSVLQTSLPGLADLEGWVLLPSFAALYSFTLMVIRRAQP